MTVSRERIFVDERVRVTDALTRCGEPASAIAVQLHVSTRTVERYRARLQQKRART